MLSLSLTYYLCLFVQLLYPTYASLKAIQSSSKLDDTQWLTYWVVYAVFSTLEAIGMVILNWIPLYYEIKLLFVLWLMAPQTQGARKIYEDHIIPLLKKYGDKIDPIFSKADAALQSNIVNQIATLVDKHGPTIAEQALKQAQEQAMKTVKLAQAAVEQAKKDKD